MNAPIDREDRARGALLGLAVGDALGAPLVGLTQEQARIKHATVETFLGGGQYLLAPGEVTARVDMVRAAALALQADAPFADRLRAGYLQVLDAGRPGLGEATRATLERIRDGVDPTAAPRESHEALERRTAGIGPALRAVAFALRISSDDELARAVLEDAAMTHADLRAGAAAVALAFWVREHLDGQEDQAAALDAVRERMGERPELPDVLPPPAAVKAFDVRATSFAPDVLHAVARHLLPVRSAKQAVVGAVNEAGAAAALGAATGAVAGARWGESGLPDAWTALVQGAPAWRTLARRLLERRGT